MLENIIKGYTNEELTVALDELIKLGETGILSDGLVRDAHTKLKEKIPTHPFSITTLEKAILWEVARRSSLYPSKIE
ncbi:hypothetical protein D3C86_1089750 [compost metagenome]